jgi:hypothetical protein
MCRLTGRTSRARGSRPSNKIMRVLLVSANIERMNILPLPLGPALVAAACRQAGHDVVLLNLMFEGDTQSGLQDCVEGFRPDVIGISVRNIDDQNMAGPSSGFRSKAAAAVPWIAASARLPPSKDAPSAHTLRKPSRHGWNNSRRAGSPTSTLSITPLTFRSTMPKSFAERSWNEASRLT